RCAGIGYADRPGCGCRPIPNTTPSGTSATLANSRESWPAELWYPGSRCCENTTGDGHEQQWQCAAVLECGYRRGELGNPGYEFRHATTWRPADGQCDG